VLAGYSFYPDYHGVLLKLRAGDGSVAWAQSFTAALLGLQLEAVASLESGGFLVGGTHVDIGPNDALVLAETDSAGNVAWLQRYDGPGRDTHASLWRTPLDNGVLLGATSQDESGEQPSALVLKVPRKNGELTFEGNGTTLGGLDIEDAGLCVAVEPYAGGTIEPITANLSPLPLVADESVEPDSLDP
jgi:hypothetical protein